MSASWKAPYVCSLCAGSGLTGVGICPACCGDQLYWPPGSEGIRARVEAICALSPEQRYELRLEHQSPNRLAEALAKLWGQSA